MSSECKCSVCVAKANGDPLDRETQKQEKENANRST